jgi:hypothetical protein
MTGLKTIPQRWVACFDILGFESLLRIGPPDYVFKRVLGCFKDAKREAKTSSELFGGEQIHQWLFSDTFVFYTENDGDKAGMSIQSVAKYFIRHCLQATPHIIPLRGAISVGDFYADATESIYFGKAYQDAYETAEAQDWIGLVLTKEAEQKMSELHIQPVHFYISNVPVKTSFQSMEAVSRLWAYDFHASTARLGLSQILGQELRLLDRKLQQYLDRKEISRIKRKYQRTIEHINYCARRTGRQRYSVIGKGKKSKEK